jgi:hypothetical protein
LPPGRELSPGLLSPYSASEETAPPFEPQLSRRHSHTRSAGDAQYFSIGNDYPIDMNGRGRLQRVKSEPTSRHNSPYKRPKAFPRAMGNARSISPGEVGIGPYNPTDGETEASSSSSPPGSAGRSVVATERIRAASSARRRNPAICKCHECGDTFTTNFARDRHMNSHTGERRFACTKPGCGQRFPTDSGRKRHERSKTLHTS